MNNRTCTSLFFPLLCLELSFSVAFAPHLKSSQAVSSTLTSFQASVPTLYCFRSLFCCLLGCFSSQLYYLVLLTTWSSSCFPSSLLCFPSPSSLFPSHSNTSPQLSYCSKLLFIFTYYLEFTLQSTAFPQVFPYLPLVI